jgi:hypothetical protein
VKLNLAAVFPLLMFSLNICGLILCCAVCLQASSVVASWSSQARTSVRARPAHRHPPNKTLMFPQGSKKRARESSGEDFDPKLLLKQKEAPLGAVGTFSFLKR